MRGEPGGQGGGLVGRSLEVDVSEEAATRTQESRQPHSPPPPRAPPPRSPLAILDTSKHDRVPKRVQLAPPSIHDITQILVNLLGRQSRMSIGSRLSSFLGTKRHRKTETSHSGGSACGRSVRVNLDTHATRGLT
jgi:hypothetical protein